MSSTSAYKSYIRSNLPSGITSSGYYFLVNSKRFLTYKLANWYFKYTNKFKGNILARVKAENFSNGELVGQGATFTNATVENRPTNPGSVVTFDAPTERLVWTPETAIDMSNKTVILVATVTAGVSATSGLIGFLGDGISYRLESRTNNGQFNARNIGSGIGFTSLDNRGTYNSLAPLRDIKTLYAISFTDTEIIVNASHLAGGRATLSGGSRTITSFELGNATSSVSFTFDEFILLDSAEDSEVNAIMAELANTYEVSYAPRTPIYKRPVLVTGDSIMNGINTASVAAGLGRNSIRDLIMSAYQAVMTDQSKVGTYITPRSGATGDALSGSWSVVTGVSLNYPANCSAVFMHYGNNDHRSGDKNIGTISDTLASQSIYGGLVEGLSNVRAELGADVPVFFIGPQFYGGGLVSPPGEEAYEGSKSLQDIRDAMSAVASTDSKAYYIEANAFGTGTPTLERTNWAAYTTEPGDSPDYLHPNFEAHALAWDIAKPEMDAVLVR